MSDPEKSHGKLKKLVHAVNPSKLFKEKPEPHQTVSKLHNVPLKVEASLPMHEVHFPKSPKHSPQEGRSSSLGRRSSISAANFKHSAAGHKNIPKPHNNLARPHNKSFSGLPPYKIEYNPYGIYNYHPIDTLGSAFANGKKQDEHLLKLTNPLSDPNDFLPDDYKQDITTLESKYTLLDEEVGSGGSATVRKVTLKEEGLNSPIYALKKFSIYSGETNKDYYNRVTFEFLITKGFSNLHCIKAYDLLQLPATLQNAWGMTMDYYEYDLYKLIKSPEWSLSASTNEKLCIFKQVCFGLKYMHEHDIVHLDLKPENILVSKNGLMKLTDFGCSEFGHVEHGNFKSPILMRTERLGTPPYQPPEVAKYHLINKESRVPFCPFKFDYWSMGILLYLLINGKLPFKQSKETDLAYKAFIREYMEILEINPAFASDISLKLPKVGMFSDPHGKDAAVLYLFWRLCDPNAKTRMTLPKLFANKTFQKMEMCVDEKLYQSNFHHHKGQEKLSFKIDHTSNTEVTEQLEVRHSKWDEIPTIPGESAKDNSFAHRKTEKMNPYRVRKDRKYDSLTTGNIMHQMAGQSYLENSDSDEPTDDEMSPSSEPSLHATTSNTDRRSRVPARELSSKPIVHPPLQPVFDSHDYSNKATEYMIVDLEDILEACNYQVVPHKHNMLYKVGRSRRNTTLR